MRVLFGCFVVGFVLLLSLKVKSQNKFSVVQGHLRAQDSLLIDMATIALINLRDSSLSATVQSAQNGAFYFDHVSPGRYQVAVTSNGFQQYVSAPFQTSDGLVIKLPRIILMHNSKSLKEVAINSKKNYIETRQDKVLLNIERAGMAGGVNVLDILSAAPGVRVNSAGNILFKAGQKALIAINGRVLNLSGQDIAEQLKNMQSSDIAQIELIANPSAKYDATGAGGLINIILKKGSNEGFNGSIIEGAGYGEHAKLGSGISMNYRNKALNFFGSYSFNENNTDHTIITNRYVGASTNFDVNYSNRQKTYAGNYVFGTDYTIDASHTLGLLVVGSFANNFFNKNTVSAISNYNTQDSIITTTAMLNRRVNNINLNLNYNGKLGHTAQTIAADADYSSYNRRSYEDLTSTAYDTHTGIYNGPQYYRNMAPTHIINLSGRVDYVNPLSKTMRLEAGLKSVFAKSDNTQLFKSAVNTFAYNIDSLLSSQFFYHENITSAYANYINTVSKKFDYQLGVRAEHTISDANTVSVKYQMEKNYTDFFPSAVFNYNATASNRFSLIYIRRIDRPNYQDLNPLVAVQDRYNISVGNAYLRPSYQDKFELKHTYKNRLVTSVYISLVKDSYNFTYFSQNDATEIYVTGKTNLKHANAYGITFNAPVNVVNWWNVNFDVDASYQRFTAYSGGLDKGAADAVFKLTQQFLLPANISVNLYGQYEVPTFYAIYQYQASYTSRISISKLLFNKRSTLSFTCQDPFNTERDRFSSTFTNLNMMGYDKKETRIMRLSFAWRFGKSTVKTWRRHPTGNSDDLKRIVGAAN